MLKQTFAGVTRRFVKDSERPLASKATEQSQLPLVIEAGEQRDLAFATALLKQHSTEIMDDVHEYGAVLLRGFAVQTAQDLEQLTSSIKQLSPMTRYFMSEPGRKVVPGTKSVFNTNSIAKTGGGFVFGAFHSENYHSPDVPAYVSFCPLQQPWYGSETCLVNTAALYAELPKNLQQKLTLRPYCTTVWPLTTVAQQQQLSVEEAQKYCESIGLGIVDKHEQGKFVVLNKPSVFRHPANNCFSSKRNNFKY